MGQYHYTVNLTKRQCLDPHKLGDGMKLVEQCGWTPGGINDALHLLLAVSNGRGGGDFAEHELVGSWGGDRIAVVGDYAEDGDLLPEDNAARIYGQCGEPGGYEDITDSLVPLLEEAFEVVYYGEGWLRRVELFRAFDLESTHGSRKAAHGRTAVTKSGKSYRVHSLIAELKRRKPSWGELPLVPESEPIERDW
jgi:hypothetical protein